MLLLLLSSLAQAGVVPMVGVEYSPLSRGDLTWTSEDRSSGLAVGEFDGFVNPSLQLYGGAWLHERVGFTVSFGVASLSSRTWTDSVATGEVDADGNDITVDIYRTRTWTVLRPAGELRVALTPRLLRRPCLWLAAGGYGDIPITSDESSGYSEEEQALADETAYADAARLGGFGLTGGLGVTYRVVDGIAVGLRGDLGWHQGVLLTEDTSVVSSWITTNASLLLQFEWN